MPQKRIAEPPLAVFYLEGNRAEQSWRYLNCLDDGDEECLLYQVLSSYILLGF